MKSNSKLTPTAEATQHLVEQRLEQGGRPTSPTPWWLQEARS